MAETKKLNVVFHGTFLFDWEDKTVVRVLAPDVPEHSYFAGTWRTGKLCPLKKDTQYKLSNIPDQTPPYDPTSTDYINNNLIFKGKLAPVDPKTLYQMAMPRPSSVLTLQAETLEQGYFTNRSPQTSIPHRVGTVHAFTYDLDDRVPCVTNLDWQPEFYQPPAASSGKEKCVANLHVFADPARRMTMSQCNSHVKMAFQKLVDLLEDKGIRSLTFSYPDDPEHTMPVVEANPDVVDKLGLRYIEMVGLAESNLLRPEDMPAGSSGGAMGAHVQTGDVAAGHYCLAGGH